MTILRDISFLWSMLHVIGLFLLLFEPRYSWRTTLLSGFAGAGTLLIANVLAMYWLGHGIIMSIAFFTCTIPTLILFYVLSKYRDGRFFFLFCLSDTSCFWMLQITNLLDRLTGDTYVMLFFSRLLIFPAVEYLFWRYLRRPFLDLQAHLEKGWWLFAATGATYYLLIMATAIPVDSPIPDTVGLLRISLVMILMPLTYLTIFRSLWRQMQLYEGTRQMEIQRQDYSMICQKMELSRIYRHDMHHHLIVLEGLMLQDNNSGALRYIQELSGKLINLTQTAWCANNALNAVLTAYLTQAEEMGCRVDADIRIPANLPYGEMDLCIILANTLENAINACREKGENNQITVRLELTQNNRFTLSVENTCPVPVEFGANGLPVAPQREGHGLGLRSVRTVADRYGGLFQCNWKDGRFLLQVVLFPPAR